MIIEQSTIKYFLSIITFSATCVILAGCTTNSVRRTEAPVVNTAVPEEVSLKEDRSKYDELRKETPEEIKRENDESAFLQNLLGKGDEDPSKIRDKFSKIVRDRRDKYDKTSNKRRDEFNKREKKERDEFLKSLQEERDRFARKSARAKTDERKSFFDDQENRRQEFFAQQRDHRHDFEAQETEARRNFEAYMTEKNNQFTSEMRNYTAAYYERQKALELKKKATAKEKSLEQTRSQPAPAGQQKLATPGTSDPDLQEFQSIPKGPAIPLGPPADK
jgi:hypothetical protein